MFSHIEAKTSPWLPSRFEALYKIFCGHTTRFSSSILNIKRTFPHTATIICSNHGFHQSFRASHEEILLSAAKMSMCNLLSCLLTFFFAPIGLLNLIHMKCRLDTSQRVPRYSRKIPNKQACLQAIETLNL